MIIQPALFIAFLPCEAVSLARKAAETCLAIRGVLLSIGPSASSIDDHVAAMQVVAEVILHRFAPVVGMPRPNPHQGNALLSIHQMHAVIRLQLPVLLPGMELEDTVDV